MVTPPIPARTQRTRPRRGATSIGQLALALAVIGGAVLIAKAAFPGNPPPVLYETALVAGSDTAPATAPTAARAIGALSVRDLEGKLVPLATPGAPSIIMVSSETCSWCKRALKDLGEMSAGRPLARLTVITLEGAAEGAPMLARERITGARLVGPSGSSDQVLLTFRYPGTPTFVAIDRNGRVVRTMPGYPIRAEMEHWYAVMVGDQDVP